MSESTATDTINDKLPLIMMGAIALLLLVIMFLLVPQKAQPLCADEGAIKSVTSLLRNREGVVLWDKSRPFLSDYAGRIKEKDVAVCSVRVTFDEITKPEQLTDPNAPRGRRMEMYERYQVERLGNRVWVNLLP